MPRLDWPEGWDRTPPAERTRNNRFKKGLHASVTDLATELERVGATDWELSTAAEHQSGNSAYPRRGAAPDDPGAVARWQMEGERYAAACDAYSRLRDNIRSLYLYVKEKRKMEERPVTTGQSEFSNVRLPSPDDL